MSGDALATMCPKDARHQTATTAGRQPPPTGSAVNPCATVPEEAIMDDRALLLEIAAAAEALIGEGVMGHHAPRLIEAVAAWHQALRERPHTCPACEYWARRAELNEERT